MCSDTASSHHRDGRTPAARRRRGWLALAVIVCLWLVCRVAAEDPGNRLGTPRVGGEVGFEPQGPGVLYDALDPAVRKWYVPQELFNAYRWRQWETSNYARTPYQRYVRTSLEGDHFYDIYGGYVTRGWLVFDWTVSEPEAAGSRLLKTSQYSDFFSNLIVASDARGQYHASVTVGDEIRTTLTPLTFSKPAFDGIQFDLASDKYETTIIASRPSGFRSDDTEANDRSNVTNLLGGRFQAQVGDFARVGVTYVNAFNATTRGGAFEGNPLKGSLTEQQNGEVREIVIQLSDDSPEDQEGGAAYFLEEIIISTTDGRRVSNQRTGPAGEAILNYHPTVEGGVDRGGIRVADGFRTISLRYDFTGELYRAAAGPVPAQITQVEFRLLLANDYRVDLTSNVQVNELNQPVFLSQGLAERTVRAPGNVKDGSNQRFVSVEYGLPTANEIVGMTAELRDLGGFDVQAEFARNRRHMRYPQFAQPDPTRHHHHVEAANAWLINASRQLYPYFTFAEIYRIDPDYSTSSFVASEAGDTGPVRYDQPTQSVYELVEDNDDQDRHPDWQRRGQGAGDDFVFPGWDENNDFVADFNQNHVDIVRPNLNPDWEEPFLRYHVDRPQFLFGVDMNNNGYIDRFENDDEPDYPYKRDRRGYNIYGGAHLGPFARLTVGRLDERQLADERRNETDYLLFTYERDFPRMGRVRVFDNLRRARDDIEDDILIWRIADGIAGEVRDRADPLPARDAWANTFYLRHDLTQVSGMNLQSKVKYEFFRQVDDSPGIPSVLPIRRTASFFGVINKIAYSFPLGSIRVEPRWKSEFQRLVPSSIQDPLNPPTSELRESAFLIAHCSLLSRTSAQFGLEYLWTRQFRKSAKATLEGSPRRELVSAAQLSNRSPYLGYVVYTHFGLRVARVDIDVLAAPQTETFIFFTVYAGFDD